MYTRLGNQTTKYRRNAFIQYFMNAWIEVKIGYNIRTLRTKCGFTQDQLATKLQVNGCDITRSALAKIEVGQRHLYPDEILLIKSILNVSYEDIFRM